MLATETGHRDDDGVMSGVAEATDVLPVETASFRALCRRAIPQVYPYVLARVGGDIAIAQDVTSEAMLAGVAASAAAAAID